MKKVFLSLLLTLWMGTGCGRGPDVGMNDAIRKDPASASGKTPTAEQIKMAEGGRLFCEFDGECEPSVALLSIATGEGVSRCSAFLISPGQLVTNDHCLSDVPELEKNCQSFVFAHFTNDVHRTCKSVSRRSFQRGIESLDYAVIELNQPLTDRKPLRISKRGFLDREKASIYRVQMTQDPKTKALNGRMGLLKCEASYRTILNVNVNSSRAPIMTFGDCPIQEGNSGSPILNANGEIAAINQGFLTVKNDIFSDMLKPYLLDQTYGSVAVGTQTRCIQEWVGSTAFACEQQKPFVSLFPNEYLDQYFPFQQNQLPLLSFNQKWTELKVNEPQQKRFVSLPLCISRKEAQIQRFSFVSLSVSFRQGITARLQGEWRPLSKIGEKQHVFIREGAGSSSGNGPALPNPSGATAKIDFTNGELGSVTLPVCSN